MNTRKNIFSQFANARKMIAYHAEWREFTGSVTATILLQQVNFLWDGNGQKAFYKFKEPCGHTLYKSGDSWTEELGFFGQRIRLRTEAHRAKGVESPAETEPRNR